MRPGRSIRRRTRNSYGKKRSSQEFVSQLYPPVILSEVRPQPNAVPVNPYTSMIPFGNSPHPPSDATDPPLQSHACPGTRYDLMLLLAMSSETAVFLKYDSFAMWQASAAWFPKTASSVTGLRVRTASKNLPKCGLTSSYDGPR